MAGCTLLLVEKNGFKRVAQRGIQMKAECYWYILTQPITSPISLLQ